MAVEWVYNLSTTGANTNPIPWMNIHYDYFVD
jgi:hypothetical protein